MINKLDCHDIIITAAINDVAAVMIMSWQSNLFMLLDEVQVDSVNILSFNRETKSHHDNGVAHDSLRHFTYFVHFMCRSRQQRRPTVCLLTISTEITPRDRIYLRQLITGPKAQYTLPTPTRRNCRVSSRRRCVHEFATSWRQFRRVVGVNTVGSRDQNCKVAADGCVVRSNPSAVVANSCTHRRRRRDATKQFRLVGGVYWA